MKRKMHALKSSSILHTSLVEIRLEYAHFLNCKFKSGFTF